MGTQFIIIYAPIINISDENYALARSFTET
jgi:hypothetical protein